MRKRIKKYSRSVSFRPTMEEGAAIDSIADARGVDRSEVIREAVRLFLETNPPDNENGERDDR